MNSCLNPLYHDIPEYRMDNQNNKIFKTNKNSGIPFQAIHKAIKYPMVYHDFIALSYELTPDAVHEIEEIFKDLACDRRAKTRGKWFSFGSISGHSSNIYLEACKEYVLKIRDNIMDKANWKLNGFAEKHDLDLKALME